MKILDSVKPTPEQLPIVSNPRDGVTLIRGAAGSGKTTTALLMLRQLSKKWANHLAREGIDRKPRILVLTYNKTLRGYIDALAKQQVRNQDQVELLVTTFGNWTNNLAGSLSILENSEREQILTSLGRMLPLDSSFLLEEVEYCTGRFKAEAISDYLDAKRLGRGTAPRMERALRQRLIDEVILPYNKWKSDNGECDWNDLALRLLRSPAQLTYDVIITDEAQDFSANQLRVVHHFAAEQSSVIFVLDAAQRIYPRGCTWAECGIYPDRTYALLENHRNTRQICQFAAPLLDGIEIGDDGTLPNLSSCQRDGPLPKILEGRFAKQMAYAVEAISSSINLKEESVAFLHPKGGGWFDYFKAVLSSNGLSYIDMARLSDWPTNSSNIALSTMHSGKGLEFDHVFILGLNTEVLAHGGNHGDTRQEALRRTLAMAITRARMSVTLGTKPGEKSDLFSFFQQGTFETITV